MSLLNSVFKQEGLEHIYSRMEEFRKIFLNLQRFLTESCMNFSTFGKMMQKTATALEDYLKNYISDDKNCYFLAKHISVCFFSFGDDFVKIFNGLSNDMNISLNEILEKHSQVKSSYLDVSLNALNNYFTIEGNYFKLLAKYKKSCQNAEEALVFYNDSQNEAKSIYNLSIMKRNLSRVKSCVQRVNKYERKLKDIIELLNSKRKAFSINALETISAFKDIYKYFLSQIYELSKKNGDALSSFMSMFTHIVHEKKLELSQIKTLSCLPFPSEFGLNKKSQLNVKLGFIEDFPDFLKSPDEINETNLLDYADWAQNYVEKVYEIAEHRRKIMKHLRVCLQEFSDLHEFFSKLQAKTLKTTGLTANWSIVGDEIFSLYEAMTQTSEIIVKRFSGYGNFVLLKINTLESVLFENQKNLKISYSSVCKTIKDHTILRNNLLKAQNFVYKASKPKAISIFSPQKDAVNLKEAQIKTKCSISETSDNIKTLIGEFSQEEKKKFLLFKETLEVVFSQMEFTFTEIVEFLRIKNEKIYKELDRTFIESLEPLFIRQINTDPKISDLYKGGVRKAILQEKDQDVVFVLEFDKETHPIYQKIVGGPSEELPQARFDNNKVNEEDNLDNSNFRSYTPYSNNNFNNLEEFPEQIENNNNSMIKTENRNSAYNIKITSPETFDIHKSKSQNLDKKISNIQNNTNNLNNNNDIKEVPEFFLDNSIRKKSLDLSICSNSLEEGKSELNSPISIKGTIRPTRCMGSLEQDKSKFAKGQNINLEAIMNQQLEKTSNFDLTASPKKKKSTYTFFKNKFGLSQDEVIDDLFSCALMDKILIQGKLFISNRKLCFHSYFNRYTLLGETKMIIPKTVILRIEKRINALIFDNSIAIITSKGEIFFTSFVFRDKAYISILKTVQPPEQKDLQTLLDAISKEKSPEDTLNSKNEEPLEEEVLPENPIEKQEQKIDEGLLTKLEERANVILALAPKDDFYKEIKHIIIFKTPCNIDDVFRILFSSEPQEYKGKTYKGFWEYVKTEKSGDIDFSMTEYDPLPPKFFLTGKNLEDLPLDPVKISERRAECTHPVKKTGVPFMPKTCPVKEIHKAYWISNKEFQIVNEIRSEKVPYADSFFITILYQVRQKGKKVELTIKIQITFVKKTMMQRTIEKAVLEETNETNNQIIFPSMEEFLKGVYKSADYQKKFPSVVEKVKGESIKEVEKEREEEEEEEEKGEGQVEILCKKNLELERRVLILEGKVKLVGIVIWALGAILIGQIVQKVLDWIFY